MRIENHLLIQDDGTPVRFHKTENWTDTVIRTRWLVMHYTAGGDAAESIEWMSKYRGPKKSGSAHLVISKTGQITQMVPFNKRAWHAGTSAWKGKTDINGYAIGIELDNFGELDGGPGHWKFRAAPVADANVHVGAHRNEPGEGANRGWAKYPQVQLDVALKVAKLLVQHYGLEDVIGHDDIAPIRKKDPGPAFPMAQFRAAAMGQAAPPAVEPVAVPVRPGQRMRVTADKLNLRAGPAREQAEVAGSKLPRGTAVRVREAPGTWLRVDVEGEVNGVIHAAGWVNGTYLEPAPAALFSVNTGTLNVRGGPSKDHPKVADALPRDTVVEEAEERNGWKYVIVHGGTRAGTAGWVNAGYLLPAVLPVNGIGQPVQ